MGFFRKKAVEVDAPRLRRDLGLAMVTLDRARPLPEGTLLTFLQDNWKELPRAKEVRQEGDTLSFELQGAVVTLTLMRAPIPWRDLEGPARAAWHWPEAVDRLKAHSAHVIVAVLAPGMDRISTMLLLTRVVAAVASTADASGVYWGEGPVVNAPDDFVDEAKRTSHERLPLYLWIAFQLVRNSDGTFTLCTSGMKAFGLMELELVASRTKPAELVDRAFNFAHYLLDHGPVLKDGDTIGLSAQERFRVRHVPSVLDPSRTVYRIEV
ncbi:DUF4261 domain-containing protein [Vitiosangium sp. GDMCC 1.1324]|uniref:DUF4261 domain-containing protein n=1 Tax=Vitiosangium sp. (strain GDMCC 1.1324) TaxID=2138576 RepID=UPI000D3D749C|nr:DUF4261 domain-containing protein [Vitiosangium sp. GDMCC 1.1324]PTL77318.1 hypothetical protein DAT35_45665 [Vitiosangium sp. GDMCC 1.1324]